MGTGNSNRVIITDVKMPFISMVGFMVKAAIAAIPAIIILVTILATFGAIIVGVFVGFDNI